MVYSDPRGPNVLGDTIVSSSGNVPEKIRKKLQSLYVPLSDTKGFAHDLARKLVVTKMQVDPRGDLRGKLEATVEMETTVTQDTVNDANVLHGAYSAFLIDFCTSLTFSVLMGYEQNWGGHLSTTLSVTYHAPAPIHSKLKIVNTTLAKGKRTMTARCEIYDITNGRLVASGIQSKMEPSPSAKL